ncbi:MAG TPA: hypothetical protein DD733_09910 [Clostridiales bacterium]|nr:hypothetical protein [Clostridiales bacterium]
MKGMIIKMKLKSLLFLNVCVLFIFFLSVIPANALGATFSLTVDDVELKTGDTFEVVVAVNNIDDEAGIILVLCSLDYDFDSLEILEWHHNIPDAWDGKLEDMTTVWDKDGERYFKCSYLYATLDLGHGVTDDNQLFTTITFRVLDEKKANGSEIKLYDTGYTNDENVDVFCNDVSVNIGVFQTSSISESEVENSDISNTISGDNTSHDADISQTETDTSAETPSFFSADNIIKIIAAAASVLIIVLFSFWLIKYFREKDKNEKK